MANKFEQSKQPEEVFEKLEIVEEPEFEELEIIREDLPEERAMEIFDPEEELAKIKKLPREEKREALAEYKEKLARQKEGLAGLQARLISVVSENPDISRQEFEEIFAEESKKLKLTKNQRTICREVFDNYQIEHRKVKKIRAEYPDDIELFKKLFHKEPKGEIEVFEEPTTLYFRCYNIEDFTLINTEAFLDNRLITEKELEAANFSAAVTFTTFLEPMLEVSVIAENARRVPLERREEILIHEKQHAIKSLFRELAIRSGIENGQYEFNTEEDIRLFSERLFRSWRENAEQHAKDEILAYMKSGEDPNWTLNELTRTDEGHSYDYLRTVRERDVPNFMNQSKNPKFKEAIAQAAKTVFENEYKALIKRGIISYKVLVRRMGYFPDRAIALLMTEPLIKWPKVVRRLYAEQKKQK